MPDIQDIFVCVVTAIGLVVVIFDTYAVWHTRRGKNKSGREAGE